MPEKEHEKHTQFHEANNTADNEKREVPNGKPDVKPEMKRATRHSSSVAKPVFYGFTNTDFADDDDDFVVDFDDEEEDESFKYRFRKPYIRKKRNGIPVPQKPAEHQPAVHQPAVHQPAERQPAEQEREKELEKRIQIHLAKRQKLEKEHEKEIQIYKAKRMAETKKQEVPKEKLDITPEVKPEMKRATRHSSSAAKPVFYGYINADFSDDDDIAVDFDDEEEDKSFQIS
ncbi:hypothetical protein F4821DRAFT_258278 [Hypoxylon rubiginosum]|uniref:Uncharacterized protein n=1 Tax=Hypoxylon rubiginosum TaxID=110542 RepID=A0ACC0D6D9_9PEZI|nr:hypothetical protein F4821DRAFT_258278 [Hypoxylon rubiginosum]